MYTFELMGKVLGRDEEEQRIVVTVPWFIPSFYEYFVLILRLSSRMLVKEASGTVVLRPEGTMRPKFWQAW
jgi:hypothetical protein